MELNNREIASLVWFTVFVALVGSVPSVRNALKKLLAGFLAKTIIISMLLMVTYVMLIVLALHRLEAWNLSQLKETLIWTFTFAFLTLFKTLAISRDVSQLKRSILDVLSIVVVLEFFMNLYVMSFFLEMLLVPIVTIVGILFLVAARMEEHASLERLLNTIQAMIGFGLICFVVISAVRDFNELVSFDTLRDLILPAVLSILYLPFLYSAGLYIAYENLFRRFGILIPDRTIRWHARFRTFLTCHVNLWSLIEWSKAVVLLRFESREAVCAALREFRINRSTI
jgi:hypothetical protein